MSCVITNDLQLQCSFNSYMYYVLLHPCIEGPFDIFFHLEMHLLLIMQHGLVVITTCHDYINHKNPSLDFATSLMMSCVSPLFDN